MNTFQALDRARRVAASASAAIWLYQGLVPKLLGPHADELALAAAFGIEPSLQRVASAAAGVAEVAFAFAILVWQRQRWPHISSAVASAVLLVFVSTYAPQYLWAAFNPVSMNLGLFALSVIAALCAGPARGDA